MRPINRNRNLRLYTDYGQARNDLALSIGWYCSYCEMPTKNMIEVEHVIPVHRGGKKLSWHNFLLCCKYCNTVKGDKNASRSGYFWPDTDNTFRAFKYQYGQPIQIHPHLASSAILKNMANQTINLLGLNREPGSKFPPTKADTRWLSRLEVWGIAFESLNDYTIQPHNLLLQKQIAKTAAASGHFSIWMEVFKDSPTMKNLFIEKFNGTHKQSFNAQGDAQPRSQGYL